MTRLGDDVFLSLSASIGIGCRRRRECRREGPVSVGQGGRGRERYEWGDRERDLGEERMRS